MFQTRGWFLKTVWVGISFYLFGISLSWSQDCEETVQIQKTTLNPIIRGDLFKKKYGIPLGDFLKKSKPLMPWWNLYQAKNFFSKNYEYEKDKTTQWIYFYTEIVPLKALNDYLKDKMLIDALRNYFFSLILTNLKEKNNIPLANAFYFDFKSLLFRIPSSAIDIFQKAYLKATEQYRVSTSGMKFIVGKKKKKEKLTTLIRRVGLDPERIHPHDKMFAGGFGHTPEEASLVSRYARFFLNTGGSLGAIARYQQVEKKIQADFHFIQKETSFFKNNYPSLFQIVGEEKKTNIFKLDVLDFFRKRTGNWSNPEVLLDYQSLFYKTFKIRLNAYALKKLLILYQALDRFSISFFKGSFHQPVQYLYGKNDALVVSYDIRKLGSRNAQAILETIQTWNQPFDFHALIQSIQKNIHKRVDRWLESVEQFLRQKNKEQNFHRSGDDIICVIKWKDLEQKILRKKDFEKTLRLHIQNMVQKVPEGIRMTIVQPLMLIEGKLFTLTSEQRSRLITELESLEKYLSKHWHHHLKTTFVPVLLKITPSGDFITDLYIQIEPALSKDRKSTTNQEVQRIFSHYKKEHGKKTLLPSLLKKQGSLQLGKIFFHSFF